MNRIVVITGCSSGIGNALAKAFLGNGDCVVATARKLDALSELEKLGCRAVSLDVNSEKSRLDLHDLLIEEYGHIDVLVNNAGISSMGPMAEIPCEKLRMQFETNVFAPVFLTQQLLPLLEKSSQATLINVGSISADLVTPFAGAYCASKAAINSITEAMRLELAPFGVRVISVQPGAIKSSFGDSASAGISEWLTGQSRYASIKQGIYARANASQKNATPADEFAKELLESLVSDKASSKVHIGKGSRLYPIVGRWFPEKLRTKLLSKRFSLNAL